MACVCKSENNLNARARARTQSPKFTLRPGFFRLNERGQILIYQGKKIQTHLQNIGSLSPSSHTLSQDKFDPSHLTLFHHFFWPGRHQHKQHTTLSPLLSIKLCLLFLFWRDFSVQINIRFLPVLRFSKNTSPSKLARHQIEDHVRYLTQSKTLKQIESKSFIT